MKINELGILDKAIFLPSPHFNQRPLNTLIDTVILHNISLPPQKFGDFFIKEFFLGNLEKYKNVDSFFEQIWDLRDSAHFLIKRNGEILQFVSTENRAWHAGVSSFKGRENFNDFSCGIEFNGSDDFPYTLKQYQAGANLITALMEKYPISLENILTHSQIAPDRKTDPGAAFKMSYFLDLINKGIEKNNV